VVTYATSVPITVTDHAMWRAAERFPGFDTVDIEQEVRSALAAGRVVVDRRTLGLAAGSDPTSLYVATEDGSRVYALRVDRDDHGRVVVTTTMRPATKKEDT
jgi:L-arabinose isomerase